MFIDIEGIARMQEKWIVRTQFKRIREIVFSDRDPRCLLLFRANIIRLPFSETSDNLIADI